LDSAVQYEYWEDYEVLTVETPENLLLRLPLAGFGPRFLALFIDSAISGFVCGLVLFALIMLLVGIYSGTAPNDTGLMIVLIIAVIVVGLLLTSGYYIIFESIWQGQTPGKRVTGIRVIKRGGQPLEFRDILLRNLLRIVDMIPTYYIVGLASFFMTKNQQRLGDLVADTVVVREFTRQLPFSWAGSAPVQLPGGQISPRHSFVISSYFQRIRELPVDVRLALSDTLIRQLGYDPGPLSLSERDSYLASLMRTSWEGSL
jgi:uncharacterized RDD family membrane protein YckC